MKIDTLKNKYELQRDDAAQRLGVKIAPTETEVSVFLDSISGEGLTLGQAIKLLAPQITVFGDMVSENVTYVLGDDGSLTQGGSSVRPFYCMNQHNRFRTPMNGNYGNFKRVSGNKRLTSLILKNAGIRVPKEIPLHLSDYFPKDKNTDRDWDSISREEEKRVTAQRTVQVKEFCKSLGKSKRIVLKPIDGQCGRDIHMCSYNDITEDLMHRDELSIESNILVQEKVNSYPIFDENGNREDWNVRALTTVDSKGKVIVAGITGRIDQDGGPVNRSITADNISLKEISTLAGWSESTFISVKKEIEDVAIKSVAEMIKKIPQGNILQSQDLAGVDVIIDEDLQACVIEVNDSDSGCIYELMCLEGIESIFPIAEAVIRKTNLGYSIIVLRDMLQKKFGKHTETLIELILFKDIEMEDAEKGIDFIGITEKGSQFLTITKLLEDVRLEEKEKSL